MWQCEVLLLLESMFMREARQRCKTCTSKVSILSNCHKQPLSVYGRELASISWNQASIILTHIWAHLLVRTSLLFCVTCNMCLVAVVGVQH